MHTLMHKISLYLPFLGSPTLRQAPQVYCLQPRPNVGY